MLLKGVGDAGEHVRDPAGEGESPGFVMDNGQVDTFPDVDTIPLRKAQHLLLALVTRGKWPPDTAVSVDR